MRKLALQNGGREGNRKSGKKVDVKALIGEEQVDVGLRIASAMVYLHERNIIFRDLKPDVSTTVRCLMTCKRVSNPAGFIPVCDRRILGLMSAGM